jgi:hypothetical protein
VDVRRRAPGADGQAGRHPRVWTEDAFGSKLRGPDDHDLDLVGLVTAVERVPPLRRAQTIFGEGGGREAAETLGVPLMAQIPLVSDLRAGGDEGVPIVLSDPDAPAAVALSEAAEAVVRATKSNVGKPLQLTAR